MKFDDLFTMKQLETPDTESDVSGDNAKEDSNASAEEGADSGEDAGSEEGADSGEDAGAEEGADSGEDSDTGK